MTLQPDHVFICTGAGAPEARHAAALGLTQGEPNVHPGQGTANHRFFFDYAPPRCRWRPICRSH